MQKIEFRQKCNEGLTVAGSGGNRTFAALTPPPPASSSERSCARYSRACRLLTEMADVEDLTDLESV